MTDRDDAPLDDPVGESLRGHHTHLARRFGRAAIYVPEVATFSTVTAAPDPRGWADLAQLLGRGQLADLFSCSAQPPADWEPVFALPARQMVGPTSGTASDAGVVELGDADVPDMLALAERTRPGPFWARTRELGTYLGVRENGALIAMAGERLRPPGWTEISAVCTAPEAHGRGHATRLITSLIARSERPFSTSPRPTPARSPSTSTSASRPASTSPSAGTGRRDVRRCAAETACRASWARTPTPAVRPTR